MQADAFKNQSQGLNWYGPNMEVGQGYSSSRSAPWPKHHSRNGLSGTRRTLLVTFSKTNSTFQPPKCEKLASLVEMQSAWPLRVDP